MTLNQGGDYGPYMQSLRLDLYNKANYLEDFVKVIIIVYILFSSSEIQIFLKDFMEQQQHS